VATARGTRRAGRGAARVESAISACCSGVSGIAACSTSGENPFDTPAEDGDTDAGGDDGTPVAGDGIPPGTASPTPNTAIFRREPFDADNGSGFAEGFAYDAVTDTFTVDGLAFDGENTYTRDDQVGSLGPFAVYEADQTVTDSFDGDVVSQFLYKAVYGVSASGNTEFAIVRTGSYVGYGFGGFIYQREGGVVLPTTGQAIYSGAYAGLRDFDGAGGLQYATGDMEVAIDFEDFNDGDGVRGNVTNRRVFSMSGTDVTQNLLDLINDEYDASLAAIPTLIFKVGPGVADLNGELLGEVFSTFADDDGNVVDFEAGSYYALIAGDNAEEIVGVIVVESDLGGDITARETGGFIVYR
jgi:hypothetical protein